MGARGLNTGVDEERLGPPAPAVALVDVPEDVDARLEAVREEPQQVPAARLDLPGILDPRSNCAFSASTAVDEEDQG